MLFQTRQNPARLPMKILVSFQGAMPFCSVQFFNIFQDQSELIIRFAVELYPGGPLVLGSLVPGPAGQLGIRRFVI